ALGGPTHDDARDQHQPRRPRLLLLRPGRARAGGAHPALRVTRATYAAFTLNGFAFASWASRIPAVKAKLGLTPRELGLVLIAIAVGSVLARPTSGPLVAKFGSRRTVATTAVLGGSGLIIVAIGYEIGVAVVVVGLFVMGIATALWDVAMNVQGALVEQHL